MNIRKKIAPPEKSVIRARNKKIALKSCKNARNQSVGVQERWIDIVSKMEYNYLNFFKENTTDETICLLSKLNVNHHIEVELNLDELDLTDVEKKATYEEIKAYVLENTGLKVSNLYIAQVKQKYGIIERENYNKPKSENARQPQCPPEKENAIKDALKHFAMI